MKRQLLQCLILLITPIICFGQYWAPKGAIWHYEQIDFSPQIYNDLKIYESIGDTVINGDSSRIIEKTSIFISPFTGDTSLGKENIYTKFDSNRVYFFYQPANEFRLLYDFNAIAGDTFQVFCRQSETDSAITVVVDSVSHMVIGGDTLKVQHIYQPEFEICWMGGIIIERIGWTGYMFPQHSWADPPGGGPLRCYEDTIIGLYQPISAIACDFITSVPELDKTNNRVIVYPNPTSGKIAIKSNKEFDTIQLQNTLGKIIQEYRNVSTIDMNDLTNGIYFLVLYKDGQKLIKKIIKTGH